jgi:hypothetical protein
VIGDICTAFGIMAAGAFIGANVLLALGANRGMAYGCALVIVGGVLGTIAGALVAGMVLS